MESWLRILGWIEFILALLVLIFIGFVIYVIAKYRHLEFNKYWRSRTLVSGAGFIWVLALLLGNQFLWLPDGGLFGSSTDKYKYLCSLHLFFTVGSFEPLFFVVFLFMFMSKTSYKRSSLYIDDPNYYVMKRSILATIPVTVAHIAILIIASAGVTSPSSEFWNSYSDSESKCVVPIISTAVFAIFYAIFLFFFLLISSRFTRSLMNKNLISRVRLSSACFVVLPPLEIVIRILVFVLKIQDKTQALFHAFFLVDIIVIFVAITEFALFPVLDSIGFTVSFQGFSTIKNYRLNYEHIDEKDIISSVHTSSSGASPGGADLKYQDAASPKSHITTQQKQALKQKILQSQQQQQNDNNNNNNNAGGGGGVEMDRFKKNKLIDRVKDTEESRNSVPSPLSSSTSRSSSPPQSLLLSNQQQQQQQPPQPVIGSVSSTSSTSSHERKKSRRFSISINRKKSSTSPESPNLTPLSTSPSTSPTSRILQPTPVDDFKSQLMKYSQNQRF
ncbi:hypothetical protein SAMD00019534_003260 [Acytostelium subglobosum LB1]|uniref:hypothetical protein n=1 Tax=Acytostelium subglobosum LB1 TaxID=1410327 RepID=UPI0006450AC5|nr:hypothetical protein SAMD00019534_003260 [Acytostelium subglobosum LB1]GAM17151.1 hypothetical protein SAMD00019534_003260 [Acytostelium subglobosum LB1]|eukprot:XP_012759213.1 hypothetical protein SAMD00019534_003260 [Acytostelium subglobosum LB1]